LLRQVALARRDAAFLGVPLLLPEGTLVLDQPLPAAEAAEVLSGGFRREKEELRSSVLRFEPNAIEASGWVDKARVVPLGEWVPLARLWAWSGLSAVGGVEPGPASRLLRRPGGDLAVAICYELADGEALRAATAAGAGWLLASANLDPYPALLRHQFTALAQLRAIENGRWLVSAANTGPSLVVDAQGRVRDSVPAQRSELGLFELERLHGATTYQIWREAPLLLMILLGGARLLWLSRREWQLRWKR
jgi:apolipoprotein N-acyltransferase